MSDNPYAPPSADLGGRPPAGSQAGTGDFEIGQTLSEAWTSTWANFPLWLGVSLVWGLATMVAVGSIIGLLLVPVLSWGFTWFFLRMHDREAEFGDAFAGFSRFGDVFVPMLVLSLIFLALSFAAQSVGLLLSLAFSILIAPRLTFAFFFLVEEGLSGTDSLKRAWEVTDPVKWKVVLLGLMIYPLAIAGLLALIVGVIPATVMFYLMYVSAYRQLAGRPAAA